MNSFFVLLLAASVSCDSYKNNGLPPNPRRLHPEIVKNQFDDVKINHENISVIDKELLWELTMVKKLEIEHSNVKKIEPGALDRLSNVKKLSLKHNLLEEVKSGVFNKAPIEELDLGDNQIKAIDAHAFDYMWNLKTVSLKNNKIEFFDNRWFWRTPSLRSVNFEHNRIKKLPEHVLNNVRQVDLFFSYNEIEDVSEYAFRNVYSFERLYLDHNRIKSVKNGTFRVVIKDLRLDHNEIVCLTADIKSVEKFNVDDNPWDQECLRSFKQQKNTGNSAGIGNRAAANAALRRELNYVRFG